MITAARILVVLGSFGLTLSACAEASDRPGGGWAIDGTPTDIDASGAAEPRQVETATLAWETGGVGDRRILTVALRGPNECVIVEFWRPVGGAEGDSNSGVDVNEGWSFVSAHLAESPCSNVERDGDAGRPAASAEGHVDFQSGRPYVRAVDIRLVFSGEPGETPRSFRIVLSEGDVRSL